MVEEAQESPKSKIETFIKSVPGQNRQLAITRAIQEREQFLKSLWARERSSLPLELLSEHGLEERLEGWERYLRLCFEKESDFRKSSGFEDWAVKYQTQMMIDLEDDAYKIQHGQEKWIKVKKSFFEYYFGGAGVDPEVWMGRVRPIDPNSLLVHSIDEDSLDKAITSGVVGRGGRASLAMCRDRIVYDRGYIVVFQANELVSAGYSLIQISEDPRDAKILREVRSPIPVDIRLARLIVPTTEIPDRDKSSKAQIATSYFGEDYLKGVERL